MLRGRPFARRHGSSVISADAPAFLLVSSVPVIAYWRPDPGMFTVGTGGVSRVIDQTGNGRDLVQSTPGSQFGFSLSAPLGNPEISSDGVDDYLGSNYTAPAPGTTQTFLWLVARRNVAAASAVMIGSGSTVGNRVNVNHLGANVVATADVAVKSAPIAMAAGTWARIEAAFANSAAIDYLKIGATSSGVGTAFGNRGGTAGIGLGANSNLTAAGANSYAEVMVTVGVPTELAALDTYVTARYGAGLV